MLSFSHPNVMSLIGVCFDEEMPLIIMPYMSNGSVLGYVRVKRIELHLDIKQATQEVVCDNSYLHCSTALHGFSPSLGRSC